MPDLKNIAVVGDHFRIEFYSDIFPQLAENYSIGLFHGATIQAWIEKTPWAEYPDHFSDVARFSNLSHEYGIPITAAYAYGPSEWRGDVNEPYGFLWIYRSLQSGFLWRYPNGSIAEDPYLVGASRSYSGRIVWREGIGPVMQPQNPYWVSFMEYWGRRLIDEGVDGIWLDSQDLAFPLFWDGGFGCSNSWEGNSFEMYLKSKGFISGNESFCIRDYVATHFNPEVHGTYGTERNYYNVSYGERLEVANASAVFEDPLLREYLVFQHLSFLNLVQNLTQTLKNYSRGRVFLTSNLYEMWPESPWDVHGQLGVLSAPYFDVVYVERNTNLLPPFHRDMAVYKMARAAGGFSKPVWVGEWTLFFSNPYPNYIPQNISSLLAILTAEGFAAGGVRTISFGTGTSWPPSRLVSGAEKQTMAKYSKFIRENKGILMGTESTADIAIIFSIPTLLWHYFPVFGQYGTEYKSSVAGWAHALETLNVQYDILIFGHPFLFDDSESLRRLSKYKLLILPDLCCISSRQLEALEDYIKNGGKVLFVKTQGQRDENYIPLNSSAYQTLRNASVDSVFYMDSDPGSTHYKSVFQNKYSLEALNDIADQLNTILNVSVSPTPSKVGISIRRKGELIIVHLINYDYHYNQTGDWVVPKWNFTITIPYNESPVKVRMISPDGKSVDLKYILAGNNLIIKVPYLHTWDIVVVYKKLPGDVDGDGVISSVDALLYLRYSVGLDISPYHIDPVDGDLTGDGRITIADALRALRISAGVESP